MRLQSICISMLSLHSQIWFLKSTIIASKNSTTQLTKRNKKIFYDPTIIFPCKYSTLAWCRRMLDPMARADTKISWTFSGLMFLTNNFSHRAFKELGLHFFWYVSKFTSLTLASQWPWQQSLIKPRFPIIS